MPHDFFGDEIQVGDVVLMKFVVNAVHQTDNGCNVDLAALGPDNEYRPSVSCNSVLTAKVRDQE